MGTRQILLEQLGGSGLISTRVFARNASLWAPLTPTLEEVSRWLNQNRAKYATRVPASGPNPGNNSLIAETAFYLASLSGVGQFDSISRIEETIRAYLRSLPESRQIPDELDEDETDEALKLAASIRSFRGKILKNPIFYAPVPGCGIVDPGTVDILDGSHLVEVKSVSRNIRPGDLRQILAYTALYYATGIHIDRVTILNPRLGFFGAVSTAFLCEGASGSQPSELLYEVVQAMAGFAMSP